MGEKIGGVDAATFLRSNGLSAHALIKPDGTIIRCRRDNQGAYHAAGHNTNSLGVEFLVPGDHDYASFVKAIGKSGWVKAAQLKAGVELVAEWVKTHEISFTRIKQHSTLSPGRKVDPGSGFPWARFIASVKSKSKSKSKPKSKHKA